MRLLRMWVIFLGCLWFFVVHLSSRSTTVSLAAPVLTLTVPVSDKCWIFTHLQKCGGSTVKKILFGYWGPQSTTYDSYQWKLGTDYRESIGGTLASESGLDVAAGGYSEALRDSAAFDSNENKCQWFTMFRHPVPRMVSAYFYCRYDPSDQLCASSFASSREGNFVTFAKHWGNFALRQFMLSFVKFEDVKAYSLSPEGGNLGTENFSEIPGWYMLKVYLEGHNRGSEEAALREFLGPVQDLLRNNYNAVGILEEFNTTLSLFDAALGIPGLDWHREFERVGLENVAYGFEEEKRKVLDEAWTNLEVKRYMRLDLLLYEHAVDVSRHQTKLYGIE